MNRRHLLTVLAASITLAACSEKKPQFNAIDLTGADYAKDFHLPDADGRMRSLSDFKGKLVALFFGYTQCPDVCPTTMAELAEAKKLLGPQGDKL
jgi:protein SCO1/2